MKSAFLVTSFEFGKDGFIIRLPSRDEVIENAGEFVSRVLDGLERAMTSALGSVIIAQVGLVVVQGLSRHAEGLGDAVFGFDFRTADAATRTGTVFGT